MRKNTVSVFNAWFSGRSERKQKSIWTDGSKIYSYNTPILWAEDGTVYINVTRYSVTTTIHQNGIRDMCANKHIEHLIKIM